MSEQYIAAVDLGTTKVVIAVARRVDEDKIEIVSLHEAPSEGVIKGDVRNLEQASQAISSVKQQIEEELQMQLSQVYVGLSGQHISCSNRNRDISIGDGSGMSEIRKDDIDRLTRETFTLCNNRDRHVITVLPQSYKVDTEDEILNPVGMEGGHLEGNFSVIEGEAAAIDRVKRCFKRAGLDVKDIKLQPLASADAVLSADEKELGVAVVDIGGGTTDLCIYSDKIIRYVSVLAIGGTSVNSDIKSIGILERQVEKLKTRFGEAMESETNDDVICLPSVNHQPQKEIAKKDLAKIIEARMMDVVEWVKTQIETTMKGKSLSGGIVLTGGGANLKNIEKLFARELQMNTRIAIPTAHLAEENCEKYSDPKYSTIVGMLYDALKAAPITEVSKFRGALDDETDNGGYGGDRDNQVAVEEFEEPGIKKKKGSKIGSWFNRVMGNLVDTEEI